MLMGIMNPAMLAQGQSQEPLPVTSVPTLSNAYYAESGGSYYVYWTVRNNDALTARVYSEPNNTNPSLYSRNLANNATWNHSHFMGSFFGGATIYATAEVIGTKSKSAYTSIYISP